MGVKWEAWKDSDVNGEGMHIFDHGKFCGPKGEVRAVFVFRFSLYILQIRLLLFAASWCVSSSLGFPISPSGHFLS